MYLEVLLECRIDDAWSNDEGEHGSVGELCDDSIRALGERPGAVTCLSESLLGLRGGGAS